MSLVNSNNLTSYRLKLWAVVKADAEVNKILTDAQTKPNIRDKKDKEAAIVPIEWSREEISQIYLNNYTITKQTDYSLLAVPPNSNTIIKMLLQKSASLSNGLNQYDISLLQSIKEHYADLAVKLSQTKLGVDILVWVVSDLAATQKKSCHNNKNDNPLLLQAALELNTVELRKLLKECANPDIKDANGNTALMLAIKATPAHDNKEETNQEQLGREEQLKQTILVLLANEANPNIQDKDGATPLMIAADKILISASSVLLIANADVNIQDNYNMTVFERIKNDDNEANDVMIERLLIIAGEESLQESLQE